MLNETTKTKIERNVERWKETDPDAILMKADYIDGQMKAEKILEEKGLKPIEYRDKCGVLHKYVMKEGV